MPKTNEAILFIILLLKLSVPKYSKKHILCIITKGLLYKILALDTYELISPKIVFTPATAIEYLYKI